MRKSQSFAGVQNQQVWILLNRFIFLEAELLEITDDLFLSALIKLIGIHAYTFFLQTSLLG